MNHPETVKANLMPEKKVTEGLFSENIPSCNTTAELSKSGKYRSLLHKLNSTGHTNNSIIELRDTDVALSSVNQESLAQPINLEKPTNNEQIVN